MNTPCRSRRARAVALWLTLGLAPACASSGDDSLEYSGNDLDAAPEGSALEASSLDSATLDVKTDNDAGFDASLDAIVDSAIAEVGPVDTSTPETSTPETGGGDAAAPVLIGSWGFDEGTGTSSADLSGNGHAATLVGGATWGTGKHGGGLTLDGTTGYADVGVALVDTTKSFTVASWANLATLGAWQIAVSEDDVTGSLFGLKLRGDGSNQFDCDVETSDSVNPGFVVAQSTSVGQVGVWVHLAGVYDASGQGILRIYVNGALQAGAALGMPVLGASGHLVIGRGLYNSVTGSFFKGTLDEIAVYQGAMTEAQVAALYAMP